MFHSFRSVLGGLIVVLPILPCRRTLADLRQVEYLALNFVQTEQILALETPLGDLNIYRSPLQGGTGIVKIALGM